MSVESSEAQQARQIIKLEEVGGAVGGGGGWDGASKHGCAHVPRSMQRT